jgi:hypothetical protein
MKDINNQVCERADDLIAFLYGESNGEEARKFERHLQQCARCETEFSAFGQIRQSIVSWRDESLGVAWSNLAVNHPGPTLSVVPATTKPSALAALREFFTLSPMWMKGAVAFASLLFCVCAVLAITYLRAGRSQSTAVQVPNNKIYSQEDLEARLAQEKQKVIESLKQQLSAPASIATVAGNNSSPRKADNRIASAMSDKNTRTSRKPLTRQERQELAADLGLSTSRDEDDLDLGGDKINQAP